MRRHRTLVRLSLILAAILSTAILSPTDAQELGVRVVTTCGATSPWPSFVNSFNYGWFTVDPNGNLCTSGGGGGGGGAITAPLGHGTADTGAVSIVPSATASFPVTGTFSTSSNQTNASQKTQIVDGSGNVIGSTSNNFNVQCANCSGSGVSTGDEATFTAGSSLFAGSGGFFQTTPTSNPLTTGQQGMLQVTANRAVFSNLRNAAGTEVGTSTTPLLVSLANTAANATAVKVDGSAVTQPVSGTVTSNAGTNLNTSALALETGGNLASVKTDVDNLNLAIASTTSGQKGSLPLGAVTTAAPTYTTAQSDPFSLTTAGALRVDGSGATQPVSGTVAVSGTVPVSGTVTANAGTSLNTSALALETGGNLASVKTDVDNLNLSQGSTTSGQKGSLPLAAVTTAAPSYTTAQSSPLSLDPSGNLRVGNPPYPLGATAETASATGTTAATTATLATAVGKTTYICSLSIRANATAAVTGNATVTGTITGTLNYTQWTSPLASGLGVTEQIFTPCVPASATNTAIAVVSAAPGSGGVVSVTATGYQL